MAASAKAGLRVQIVATSGFLMAMVRKVLICRVSVDRPAFSGVPCARASQRQQNLDPRRSNCFC